MGRPGKKLVRLGVATNRLPGLFDDPCQEPDAVCDDLKSLPAGFDPSNPEVSYSQFVSLEHRRRSGQFFTPQPIASLLCRWAGQESPQEMLDPAAGLGILSRTFHRLNPECKITAFEVDPLAAAALSQVAEPTWRSGVACRDFLTWGARDTFDAIVANPPYLRHHDLCYPAEVWRRVERESGVKLSRLTNVYVLFILEICRRLKPGGRAAVIVPGEWLNANFGISLKEFLLRGAWLQQLVYFSHAEVLFEDALTTACLLLIRRPHKVDSAYRLRTLFVPSSDMTPDLERMVLDKSACQAGVVERYFLPDELLVQPKWNSVLENGLPTVLRGWVPLAEIATTCRGIATGANSFFHLSAAEAKSKGLQACHLKPCIGRARDVVGYVFHSTDYAELERQSRATRLWCAATELTSAERAYLVDGERASLPDRYLLSQRSPWYAMERREPASIWAAVFGRGELRFVHNEAGILNLTTFHAVYPTNSDPSFARALTACLNSGIVQERAKLQHRVYGGGLIKFEPRDLLEIEVPDLRRARPETITILAECLLALDAAVKSSDNVHRQDSLARLNAAVLTATAEAVSRLPDESLEDQSALGPLWARRTHHDDPAS